MPMWSTMQSCSRLETPICLDESISSVYMAEKAIELGACKVINIKPGRCGGLYNAKRINQLAQQAGIGCWIGGMLESAKGKQGSNDPKDECGRNDVESLHVLV